MVIGGIYGFVRTQQMAPAIGYQVTGICTALIKEDDRNYVTLFNQESSYWVTPASASVCHANINGQTVTLDVYDSRRGTRGLYIVLTSLCIALGLTAIIVSVA